MKFKVPFNKLPWMKVPVMTVITLFALAGCNMADYDELATDTDTVTSGNPTLIESGPTAETTARSVRLSWMPPVERVNGEPLDDALSGYELRYRKACDSDNYTVVALDAGYQFYTIDDLTTEDQYVFEVAAIDRDGVYSEFVTASAP